MQSYKNINSVHVFVLNAKKKNEKSFKTSTYIVSKYLLNNYPESARIFSLKLQLSKQKLSSKMTLFFQCKKCCGIAIIVQNISSIHIITYTTIQY